MDNRIKFQDNNHHQNPRKNWADLEWIDEFYGFLQGEVPEGIRLPKRGYQPKLSEKKAFAIIWYLQAHMRILPDHIERCDICGSLYDSYSEGRHWQSKGKDYCGSCDHLVPYNYDRGKR